MYTVNENIERVTEVSGVKTFSHINDTEYA